MLKHGQYITLLICPNGSTSFNLCTEFNKGMSIALFLF